VAVFWLGGKYGTMAAALGFAAVAVFVALPGAVLIWLASRRRWHAPPAEVQS